MKFQDYRKVIRNNWFVILAKINDFKILKMIIQYQYIKNNRISEIYLHRKKIIRTLLIFFFKCEHLTQWVHKYTHTIYTMYFLTKKIIGSFFTIKIDLVKKKNTVENIFFFFTIWKLFFPLILRGLGQERDFLHMISK